MDWTRIKRKPAVATDAAGVYVELEQLVRIRFQARDFSFLPTQPVTSVLSGRYASRLRGRGLNFEELRRYLPGDDVRTIDWKVTARTREAHVRVYTEEKERSVLLLVDQRQHMFFGTRRQLKSVTAAELAALAAWRALAVGDRVGALVFNDRQVVTHRPRRGEQRVLQVLGEVVRQNRALPLAPGAPVAPGMLNRALTDALRLAPHDVLVVLISDGYGVDGETERLTALLAEHNDVLPLLVHDPTRLDPGDRRLAVSDGILQMDLDLGRPAVRATVQDDYRAEQEAMTHYLRRLAIPLLPVSNAEPVVPQIRRLLGVPGRR